MRTMPRRQPIHLPEDAYYIVRETHPIRSSRTPNDHALIEALRLARSRRTGACMLVIAGRRMSSASRQIAEATSFSSVPVRYCTSIGWMSADNWTWDHDAKVLRTHATGRIQRRN